MTRARRVMIVAAGAAWAAAAVLSMGSPRLTLVNAAVTLTYPRARGLAALAAAAFAVAAAVPGRRWIRGIAVVLVIGSAAAGVHLLRYRVVADAAGLSSRSVVGTTALSWSDVARVESGPGLILLTSSEGQRLRVDTTDFLPEQRAALDRTIARRLRPPAAPP